MAQQINANPTFLALDTSASACSVAIFDGKTTTAYHEILPRQQTQFILPTIDKALKAAAMTIRDINVIAFGSGPGSFTGIRLACSVAQGLAFAANIPVVSVSSLAAAAQAAYQEFGYENTLGVVDARVGQIYCGYYQICTIESNNVVELIGNEMICLPSEIVVPATKNCYGIGDGWGIYREELITRLGFTPLGINPEVIPTAEAVLVLAKVKFAQGGGVSAENALPNYLR